MNSKNQLEVTISGNSQGLSKAVNEADASLNKLGNTTKQTAFAMRQVPMQFTDIVVSLQAGQSPMQVLLQQGGQLKDMFGGVGNAARALGGYLLTLITPLSLGATAVAALGFAYYKGSQQVTSFQNAIINTGNIAGTSAGNMQTLAQSVANVTGQYGDANTAVQALVASGKISGDQLAQSLTGVLAGVKATGLEVDELAGRFADLANDPLKAIVKLNETENFLTLDIYKQIKSLIARGKHHDAANLAIKTYADTLQSRQAEVLDNLGGIEKGWREIAKVASFAWNQMLGVGRTATVEEKITEAQAKLNSINSSRFGFDANSPQEINAKNQALVAQAKVLNDLLKIKTTTDAKAAAQAKQAQQDKDAINKDILDSKNTKTNKPKAETNSIFAAEMRDTAALILEVEKLDNVEKSRVQTLQEKLNAYSNLDPKLKEYLQTQIDIAATAEQRLLFDKLQQQSDDAALQALEEQSAAEQAIIEQKNKSFEDLTNQYLQANEDANAQLIVKDKDRARAQLDIEHERAQQRIAMLMLEQEQVEALLEQENALYETKLKEIDQQANKTSDTSRQLGLQFRSAFEDAVIAGNKFSDVLEGIGQDLIRLALRKNVTEPIFEALGNFDFGSIFTANATGGVYAGAGINAYSNSVVSKPTIFPFAKGTGLMGEAGPEAILPLTRVGGDLGVKAMGGGVNLEVNVINAPSQPKVSQSRDESGKVNLEIMFDAAEMHIAKNVSNSKGSMFDVLSGKFGMQPITGG